MSDAHPLSPGQEDLWLHHQAHPDSASYNAALALRIASPVDVDAMRTAFSTVVDRHEQLHSSFEQGPAGRVERRLPKTWDAEFLVHDVFGTSTHEIRSRVQQFVDSPFRLEKAAGSSRAAFFKMSDDEGVLVVVAHHIVTDFVSHGQIVADLLVSYDSAHADGGTPLAPLSVSYADFVDDELRDSAAAADALRRRIAAQAREGVPAPVSLPGLVPSERLNGTRTTELALPVHLLPLLRAAAHEAGTSLFAVLLTAYQEVLRRHAGDADPLIVCPVTSPRRRHFPGAVGYFVKPALIRATGQASESFAEAVRRTHAQVDAARTQPQPSVAQLAAHLGPGTGGTVSLNQFGFGYQRTTPLAPLLDLFASGESLGGSSRRLEFAGLQLSAYDIRHQEGQFDIALEVVETSVTAKVVVRHRLNICGEEGAHTVATHFVGMLEAAPGRLHKPVRSIPMSGPEEDGLLRTWSSGARVPVPDQQVHELIAECARRNPTAPAVRTANSMWSYADLEMRAERVAAALHRRGITVGDRVGICLRRTPEQISVMLGILRAGAAFVPLDPEYPADRLAFMATDADVRCVVAARGAVPEGVFRADRLLFEEAWERQTVQVQSTAPRGSDAYVIYTSGSTGLPKGVAIGHASLSHLALWQRQHFRTGPQDVVLRFASASFDAFVWEVLLALTTGASLYVPDPDVVLVGSDLAETIRAGSVTHVALPPSIVSGLEPAQVESLMDIVVAGEDCAPALAARWITAGRRVSNVYGQTETTIGATLYRVHGGEQFLPVGPPIHNARVEVVDGDQAVVPIGVPGEILVSGPMVASGYLNQPERTARTFLPAGPDRERSYRSGDLGCWTAEGELRFLGRRDTQVKVRGFRIEPGEVEAALTAHSSVRDAAVVAVGGGGRRRLVAFVTGPAGETAEAALRGWLARRLPAHAVPSTVVVLDDMPRTPNGKIDRARLALAAPLEVSDASSASTLTGLEATVASVWAALLNRSVGPHDDFFAVGGHSLMAVEAVGLLQERLGYEIPLRLLFTHPTVAGLAAELETARAASP